MTSSSLRHYWARPLIVASAAALVQVGITAAADFGSDPQRQANELLAPTIARRAAFSPSAAHTEAHLPDPQEQARWLLDGRNAAASADNTATHPAPRANVVDSHPADLHEDAQSVAQQMILAAHGRIATRTAMSGHDDHARTVRIVDSAAKTR
jgi:hypothetical protein